MSMNMIDQRSDENFVLPRWIYLYSRSNIANFKAKDVFSKNNLLRTLSDSQTAARVLVKHMFLSQNKPSTKKRKAPKYFLDDAIASKHLRFTKPGYITSTASRRPVSRFLKAFSLILPSGAEKISLQSEPLQNKEHLRKRSKFSEKLELGLPSQNVATTQHQSTNRGTHIPKRLRKAIEVCRTILCRFKKHKIHYIFEEYCSLPNKICPLSPTATIEDLKHQLSHYMAMQSSINQVFLFLRAVIRWHFPTERVWKTKVNELAFFKNLKVLLLCRRFDKITVKDMCQDILIDSISWVGVPMEFYKFMKWMCIEFVFEVVKRFFYVTDGTKTAYRLYYFRKDVWCQVVLIASRLMVEKNIWVPILSNENVSAQYKVRFCPKTVGVRPIMKKIEDNKEIEMMPSCDILKILQYICKKHPTILGCSVLSANQIGSNWREYWQACRKECTYSNTSLQLYFVKMDLDACFDSIPIELLLNTLHEVLIRSSCIALDRLFTSKKYTTVGAVCDKIYQMIEGSLNHVILDVYGKVFKKLQGIPQGWGLSSILCNLFYGDFEINHLQDFMKPNGDSLNLLMRFTDDYLFVSTEKNEAERFIQKMYSFVENEKFKYGFNINWSKTCCNFSSNNDDIMARIRNHADKPFSWFGLLFPTFMPRSLKMKTKKNRRLKESLNKGGVSIDLSRYSGATGIRDSVTVYRSASTYHVLHILSRSLRLRVAPICFDLKVNSHFRVLCNVYEIALLTACKWLVHELSKPKHIRMKCSGNVKMMVVRLAVVALLAIRKKLPEQNFPRRNLVVWIFLKAFYRKLLRYQTICGKMHQYLKEGMKHQQKLLERQTSKCNRFVNISIFPFPKEFVQVHVP